MHKILIVDDDPGMRVLLKRLLSFDYEVCAAEGGDEALELLQDSPDSFAVIVADMSMAHGNGLHLLARARTIAPHAARILLSGDHRLNWDRSVTSSADLFRILLKPADNPTIAATVRAGVACHLEGLVGLAA